ncbi:MAG: cupredoxin domain-containing protein, partial [Nitrososphaeraceae archaeon]
MVNKYILFILPIILALTIHLAITETFAQLGSMSTLQNIDATYAISIVPGAAQKENIYHYYPPQIAVPVGTTIAWFNNDFGQPHTVTSGQPKAADEGSVFNSGVMPATANSFFQFTFTQPGEYLYHCIIHPWRVASVSASDAYFTGEGFKIGIGSGASWDISTHPRVLLDITPQTIPLDKTTPITY